MCAASSPLVDTKSCFIRDFAREADSHRSLSQRVCNAALAAVCQQLTKCNTLHCCPGMPVSWSCALAFANPCLSPPSLVGSQRNAVKLSCSPQQRQHCVGFDTRILSRCTCSAAARVQAVAVEPETLQTVKVSLGDRSYPIYIGQGLLSRSDLLQQHILGKKVLVVTNSTVAPLYLKRHVLSRMHTPNCSISNVLARGVAESHVFADASAQLQQAASMMLRSSVCLMVSSTRAWRCCSRCGTKHCRAG